MAHEDAPVHVSVRNLGGIDARSLTFDPGVTVLTGRNATNRTSVLRSVAAALGGSAGELKADADEGGVELTVGEETYTRRFERTRDAVQVSGDPFTDQSELVDLFSCVLASNPARAAAERGDGEALRDVIMRPVNTEEIRAEIDRHQREIRSLSDELASLESEIERIPDLERELAERREERESVVADLERVRAEVDDFEADADAAEAAEAVVADLRDARSEFETARNELETQRNALASLEDERERVAADLAETSAPEQALEAATDELDRLQQRQREYETTITNLVSIVEFNEELAEGAAADLPGESGGVVDELDPTSRQLECWTCGTTVERDAITERIDDLRDVVDEKRARRNELRTQIADQREEVSDLRSTVQEAKSLAAELEDIDAEIEQRESRIADLETRVEDLRDRIDDLEARAGESEGLRDSELLERYQRLSELEYERGQLDEAIDSLETEIAAAEESREQRDDLASDLADHEAQLTELRGRIADLERAAVETFNEQMATLLERMAYENVERVWLERKSEGAGDDVAPESTFDLHVVRSTPDGSVYEDTVTHLSESEREVIGLVVALAGYLVHDVHESVPFVLLDSLEAIDADRIAALVDYFADHAPYLLVALLPEDAEALADGHDRIVMNGAVA